jgi:hypothetical protein
LENQTGFAFNGNGLSSVGLLYCGPGLFRFALPKQLNLRSLFPKPRSLRSERFDLGI